MPVSHADAADGPVGGTPPSLAGHPVLLAGLEAEQALNRLAELACAALGVPVAFVVLRSQGEEVLESCAGEGAVSALWARARAHLPLCRRVVQSGEPLVVEDVRREPAAPEHPATDAGGAFLGAPLLDREGEVLGVLGVLAAAPRRWTEREVRVVRTLASAAVAELRLQLGVAERERLQEELHHSEVLYRQLVESASDVIYRADRAGHFIYANPAAARVTGYSEEELVGMHFADLVRPDYHERLNELYARQILEEIPNTYLDFPIRTRGGREVWLGQNVQLLREQGVVAGVQAVARDITAQRQVEQALRESEERFRLMVEGSEQVFFYVHDVEHRFEYLSPSVAAVLGFDPEELIGRPYDVLLAGDALDSVVHEQTHRGLDSGSGVAVYTAITRNRDGQTVPIELVETPVVQDGVVVGMQGFARDITERQRAREALERSEEYFRSLTENSLDLIHVINLDGTTRYFSPSATRLLGYHPDELQGATAADLIHPDDIGWVLELIRSIRKTGEAPLRDLRVRHRDGQWRVFEAVFRNLLDDPVVAGVVINSRDITERRASEAALRESEESYRLVVESVREVIFQTDCEGRWTFLNPAWTEITGFSVEESLGTSGLRYVHPDDRDTSRRDFLPLITGDGESCRHEVRFLTRDGDHCWMEVQARRMICPLDGSLAGTTGTLSDVTHRRRAEEENLRLAALSRENPNPVLQCDDLGNPVHVNPAAETVSRDLGVMAVSGLLPVNHAQLVRSSLETGQGFQNVEAQVADHIFSWTYRPHPESGTVYLFAVDITGRRHMEEQLRHDALHDALTGLPNRLLFMERLAHAILRGKRRPHYQYAVLFLDLDRFKVINDSLGHHVGDELLIHVARRLQSCLRDADTVARLGGDEFAILLEDIHGPEDATRIAERIRAELAAPVNLSGLEVFTSTSVGIALSSNAYERPEYLLRNADMAMYRAKAAGHARYEVFDRAMHAQALTRLQLETDLRRALERQEFELHYQPIISLRSGRIDAVEALVRWAHPDRGRMAPDEFIPVAEETGLILSLGEWVLREACARARAWQLRHPGERPLAVGVNLSAKQFSQPDLVEQVGRILEETGLPAASLRLEITESAVMESPESAAILLGRLKALGVQISLDDFGTGYSSLAYLHRFPLDTLKIDRSFVGRMDQEDRSAQLVHTILTLARSLGVTAVAEGIETPSQRDALHRMECELGQGYLFSTPLPAAELEALLDRAATS